MEKIKYEKIKKSILIKVTKNSKSHLNSTEFYIKLGKVSSLANFYFFSTVKEHVKNIKQYSPSLKVDFIVCVGSEDVIKSISAMFQQEVPPIMLFNGGKSVFVPSYKLEDFEDVIKVVLNAGVEKTSLQKRDRLQCSIIKWVHYFY